VSGLYSNDAGSLNISHKAGEHCHAIVKKCEVVKEGNLKGWYDWGFASLTN
jgi:hypothetical protein